MSNGKLVSSHFHNIPVLVANHVVFVYILMHNMVWSMSHLCLETCIKTVTVEWMKGDREECSVNSKYFCAGHFKTIYTLSNFRHCGIWWRLIVIWSRFIPAMYILSYILAGRVKYIKYFLFSLLLRKRCFFCNSKVVSLKIKISSLWSIHRNISQA